MAARRTRSTTRRLMVAVAAFAIVLWGGLWVYRGYGNLCQAHRYALAAGALRYDADTQLRGGGPIARAYIGDRGLTFVAARAGDPGMERRDLASACYRQAEAYDRVSRSYWLAALRGGVSPGAVPPPEPFIYDRAAASKP